MGKTKTKPADAIEAEDVNQETPDVEHESQEREHLTGIEMVRRAMAAGHETPKPGVAWIKEEYGVDMKPNVFSSSKQQIGKKHKASEVGAAAVRPSDNHRQAVPTSLGKDLRAIKGLIDQAGDAEKLKEMITQVADLMNLYGQSQVEEMIDLVDSLS